MQNPATEATTIRSLCPDDLAGVVAIDASIEGHSRRNYIERRLQAALREPALHAQFAATDGRGLAGFLLARVLEGEFGRNERALRIELVGTRADARGRGIGTQLVAALRRWSARHAIAALRTQASWRNHAMLRWLDSLGFALAPAHVLVCAVDGGSWRPERDDAIGLPEGEGPAQEINFGRSDGNDFERAARDCADVRAMALADLDEIVRIDRRITGRDRSAYLHGRLQEALADSNLRVSLAVRREGALSGYLMARADHGDFGRTEPAVVLDTIGVDPDQAHHGIGHALMSQLFANLGGLRIERVETLVEPEDFALLGFLFGVGFKPSQRLAFVYRLKVAP